jgi:methylthioribose-1-phosphate isomerase
VRLLAEAHAIREEDYAADCAMGKHGAALLPPNARVLTICNTGALATGGIGTALGILRVARQQGTLAHVYACETRPRLQGLKLTAWELLQEGIPFEVIADSAAGTLMAQGKVDAVIAGCRPNRRQRRHRQQNRHLHAGGAGALPWGSILHRRAPLHDRPSHT